MANNPLKVTVELTFHELNQVLAALKSQRSNTDYQVQKDSVEGFNGYKTDEIAGYSVTQAEEALTTREALADLVYKLSGEIIAEKPEHVVLIREARKAFDAQEARKAADEARESEEV